MIFIFICILYSHLHQLILRKLHFLIFILVKNSGDHLSMGTELVGDWQLFVQRDQWIGHPLCGTKCPGNIFVWDQMCYSLYISTRKNINFNLDLIELIDFYFRLHFVFILISIHILQYKECGQSWKLILRKLHFLIFILVVMGHHDFKIWTSNWVEFSSNLYFWKTECHFFCFISKPCVLSWTFQQNFLNSLIYINP